MSRTPALIALCGAPGSGKSTTQHLLTELFDIQPVDDGDIIRRHVMELAGLTSEDVYTQEGKLRQVTVFGKKWQVRELLGKYGNLLEGLLGDQAIPEIAIGSMLRQNVTGSKQFLDDNKSPNGYSFGSVRRQQGLAYKKAGGVVVEILSGNEKGEGWEFDSYDRSLVDFTIQNPGTSLEALKDEILRSPLTDWINGARDTRLRAGA